MVRPRWLCRPCFRKGVLGEGLQHPNSHVVQFIANDGLAFSSEVCHRPHGHGQWQQFACIWCDFPSGVDILTLGVYLQWIGFTRRAVLGSPLACEDVCYTCTRGTTRGP